MKLIRQIILRIIIIIIINNNNITHCLFKQQTNYYGVIKLNNKEFNLVPLNYGSNFNETINIKLSSFEITSSSRVKIKKFLLDLKINSDINNHNQENNNNSSSSGSGSGSNSGQYNMILYGNIIESRYKNNHKFNIIRIYHYLNQKDNNIINQFNNNNNYNSSSGVNKSIKYYYLIKSCSSHSLFNSNKCNKFSLNLIELNTFSSIEINSKLVRMDNYNSNSIPGFDDMWFKKKLFDDNENQRMLIQGCYDDGNSGVGGSKVKEDSFQLINSFIHIPDPYKTCDYNPEIVPYCPYRQFPFYVRDSDRCLNMKGCVPLGVCLSSVKPVCIEGYKLTSYRGESNGCYKYYCDFNLVDQINSKY